MNVAIALKDVSLVEDPELIFDGLASGSVVLICVYNGSRIEAVRTLRALRVLECFDILVHREAFDPTEVRVLTDASELTPLEVYRIAMNK